MKRYAIQFAAFIVGFGLLAGITWLMMVPSMKTLQSTQETIVQVHWTKTNCSQPKECNRTVPILADGTFGKKKLTREDVFKIKELIGKSDLVSLQPNLRPDCPSFAGGEDLGFSFPTKYGKTIYTVCQYSNMQNTELVRYLMSLI